MKTMIARIRKRLEEKEQGFTLVELLVVIIIIGILAAIAVPIYLNQQAKAKDSAAKSDLANYRTLVAAWVVENPTPDPTAALINAGVTFPGSPHVTSINTVDYVPGTGSFCIQVTYTGGTLAAYSSDENGELFESDDCS